MMRVLFLSRWFPVPADNGSKLRVLHLLKALAGRHQVTLASFTSEAPTDEDVQGLRRWCSAVHTVPLRPSEPRRLESIRGLFDREPRSVRVSFHLEMRTLVQGLWESSHPDLVVASEIDMAPYALHLPRTPAVLDELQLAAFYGQIASSTGSLSRIRRRLMWAKREAYTRRLMGAFDACTVVSPVERELVRRVAPNLPPPEVIPNGADLTPVAGSNSDPVAGSIIYAGSVTYAPNLEAVAYFIRDILPQVRAAVPETIFTVTGRTDGVDLDGLREAEGVRFSGPLDDIRSAIARSWLSVAPICSGGGTRLKILESLAVGTPVVSTSKGVEGLDLVNDRHVLVADDPQAFATAVVRLLCDPKLRRRLGEDGRREVARLYDWERIGAAFCSVVEHAASARTG